MNVIIVAVFVCTLAFALGAVLGAPFLPTRRRDIESLLDLADLGRGQRVIDLGCGDGRLLAAAARRGLYAVGYEVNPVLFMVAKARCHRYGSVEVKLGNFWSQKLPDAEAILVFLVPRYVQRLDQKLKREVKRPTKVVSYIFELPRDHIRKTNKAYLYRYSV